MNILALDLATQLGFAHGYIGKKPKHGTVSLHDKKWDGAGIRFVKFQQWIRTTIKENDIDIVVYEGVRRHTGTTAAHVYGGWLSTLWAECETMGVPYTAYGVTTIKKFWTGKGSASKEAMLDASYKRGFDPADDNAADALAIWHLAQENFSELEA